MFQRLFYNACRVFLQALQPPPAENAPAADMSMGGKATPLVLCRVCGMQRVDQSKSVLTCSILCHTTSVARTSYELIS